jgi:hypothetical protein
MNCPPVTCFSMTCFPKSNDCPLYFPLTSFHVPTSWVELWPPGMVLSVCARRGRAASNITTAQTAPPAKPVFFFICVLLTIHVPDNLHPAPHLHLRNPARNLARPKSKCFVWLSLRLAHVCAHPTPLFEKSAPRAGDVGELDPRPCTRHHRAWNASRWNTRRLPALRRS